MNPLNIRKIKKHKTVLTSVAFLTLSASLLYASDPLKEEDLNWHYNPLYMSAKHTQELDDELKAVRLNITAKHYNTAGDITKQIGKGATVVGPLLSMVGSVDPEPHSAIALQGAGMVIELGGKGLQKVVSPLLIYHSENLKEEAARKTVPLNLSEAIDKEIDKINKESTKLYAKLTDAKADKWYRNLSLTSHGERIVDAERKYRPRLNANKEKLDELIEMKDGINSELGYLEKKSASYLLSSQEEKRLSQNLEQIEQEILEIKKEIHYLLPKIIEAEKPNIYQELITLRVKRLSRLQENLDAHR